MEETKLTTIELTDAQRAAIEEASGRPGYGALRAGILRLLAFWQERQEPVDEREAEAVRERRALAEVEA